MYPLFEEFINSQESEESKSVEDKSIEATNKLKEIEDKINIRNEKVKQLTEFQKELISTLNKIKSTIGNSYETVRSKNSDNIKRTGKSLPVEELYSLLNGLNITGVNAKQAVDAINNENELEKTEKEIKNIQLEITKLKEASVKVSTIINKLKNAKTVNENNFSKNTFELTDLKYYLASRALSVDKVQQLVNEHTVNNLTYKGFDFFNIIHNVILDESKQVLEIGVIKEYDDDDGEFEDEYNYQEGEISGNLCYLGYVPDLDMFISGWYMDGPTDRCTAYIKIDEFGEIISSRSVNEEELSTFYNFYPDVYNNIHNIFFNRLIDIIGED